MNRNSVTVPVHCNVFGEKLSHTYYTKTLKHAMEEAWRIV